KRLNVGGSRGIAQVVAGGDCRILTDGDEAWRVHPGGVERYVSANRAFHEEVRDAVIEGKRHRTEVHDSLASLEALLACVRSVVDGDAVKLPLKEESGEPASGAAIQRPEPEVSVIVPSADHRGYAQRAGRS